MTYYIPDLPCYLQGDRHGMTSALLGHVSYTSLSPENSKCSSLSADTGRDVDMAVCGTNSDLLALEDCLCPQLSTGQLTCQQCRQTKECPREMRFEHMHACL